MDLYRVSLSLHLLALSLWLGHMFVWAVFVGPANKRLEPPEVAETVRRASVWMGGLGWPALAVLIPTGLHLLSVRGIGPGDLLSGAAFAAPGGGILALKLAAVGWMIVYQAIWAHRPAPRAIWSDIVAALVVLACSVALVRGLG
ncbi:hypothetical protein HRbin40_02383 [bacterium HR40]|nr:hypothetical protein HRbin40_02383 [bacterium HR40]